MLRDRLRRKLPRVDLKVIFTSSFVQLLRTLTCIHTFIYRYIHTYIHTYIHIEPRDIAPAVAVPLPNEWSYFLLDEFNHHHQHSGMRELYVCMYVCMNNNEKYTYLWLLLVIHIYTNASAQNYVYAMQICMYVCMYVCMHVCMHVWMNR